MQALTCAPGTLNDGTASVSTTNSVQEKMLDILRTKKPQIHADFLKSLNNASAYDVNYALSATGAAATEECESTLNGGPISPACKNLVATGLTDRVLVELQTGRDPTSEAQRLQGTLEDEFPLRQTELYRSVSDRYLQQISNELGRPQVENHLR